MPLLKSTEKEHKRDVLKAKKRQILIEYLSNPENEPLPRCRLATQVLKYRQHSGMYVLFTPVELCQVEAEALDLRRKRFAMALMRVDDALLRRAAEGDPQACKLVYMRFEGWEPSERKRVDVTSEIRAQVFRELLDALNAENPGFSDLFGDQKETTFIPAELKKIKNETK